jgi:hypothetical protein
LPIKIFGQNWCDIPDFLPHAAGPISSRQELQQALESAAALIHLWPTDHPHPVDTAGPPVIRLTSRGMAGLIADAHLASAGKLIKPPAPATDSFHTDTLARILRAVLPQ